MKSVLISIRPKWCEKILSGEKTIEVRKTAPGEVPLKCYIYCTKNGEELFVESDKRLAPSKLQKGKVIGEFICDKVDEFYKMRLPGFVTIRDCSDFGYLIDDNKLGAMCLSYGEVIDYGQGKTLYGWHISDLKIYDKPKNLNEITPFCGYKGERCECCSHYVEAFGGCCKTLKRPPQSWQYVEEVEE